MKVLDRSFYSRPTLTVAKELLGKLLVFGDKVGQIVETEGYLGPEDLASHARFKSRKRNFLMFGSSATVYVYFTYGMYHMLNIVAKEEGQAGAVLIRAIEPVRGIHEPTDGPGKLTRALGITKEHNGLSITEKPFLIAEGSEATASIITTPRIGIDYAGAYKDKPWRFLLNRKSGHGHAHASYYP